MRWERHPRGHGYADYRMISDSEELTSVWVRWVGHPTATYKYMLRGPDGELRTYQTVGAAKRAAEYIFNGGTDEDTIRLTR